MMATKIYLSIICAIFIFLVGQCKPAIWLSVGENKCYTAYATHVMRFLIASQCNNLGWRPAVPNDIQSNNYILEIVSTSLNRTNCQPGGNSTDNCYVWLGLINFYGTLKRDDNSQAEFSNWEYGYPSKEKYAYVAMNILNGKWIDVEFNDPRHYGVILENYGNIGRLTQEMKFHIGHSGNQAWSRIFYIAWPKMTKLYEAKETQEMKESVIISTHMHTDDYQ
ncbi:uncharacterized protein LOC120331222 isoform X2 [Styela clava]|uniref:uncharacterized protein LOC120331222 isoform X2 n=1 Tax=Styela clava TaxID=7725 RepID=UPI00193A1681|nr:uncharacterized protein LOC120331222 isoform X2 [Styela clava]